MNGFNQQTVTLELYTTAWWDKHIFDSAVWLFSFSPYLLGYALIFDSWSSLQQDQITESTWFKLNLHDLPNLKLFGRLKYYHIFQYYMECEFISVKIAKSCFLNENSTPNISYALIPISADYTKYIICSNTNAPLQHYRRINNFSRLSNRICNMAPISDCLINFVSFYR